MKKEAAIYISQKGTGIHFSRRWPMATKIQWLHFWDYLQLYMMAMILLKDISIKKIW